SFACKGNLSDITNPLSPVSLGGGFQLNVSISDNGEPGSTDSIGWTLWNGSTLLYSSKWDGTKTVEQGLGGGNLVVHENAERHLKLTVDLLPGKGKTRT